tara:strand:- start:154 stop:390 length:237 start_codon:yes stop_codon:yes gene_type:complete
MAYGTEMADKPAMSSKKKVTKVTKVTEKKKVFSAAMEKKLKEHSKHHSAKHMAAMRRDIKSGMSFSAAHKKAMKLQGK